MTHWRQAGGLIVFPLSIAEIQTKRLEAEGPPRTAARQLSHRGSGPGPLVSLRARLIRMAPGTMSRSTANPLATQANVQATTRIA